MEIKKLFSMGVAEQVMSMQLLKLKLEEARACFERNNTDANWAKVEEAQKAVDNHKEAT
jgi:hypothetical protein